ncbi:hypothetical protein QWY85_03415 [Neolewinella lacunae]|uniref:Uncharacterized protein n=1 Tax=Neolewinella lacunae TaxID=1517758 RepID=A0A923PHS5_9BACT|nr:hypothetical protein [Neolewinella lacunae]MBC6992946.1 hypothetical protein [Neolewinella lacunae]MDN3633690.1 hypothetical protein [Neolewinella lacunae]
MTNYQTGQFHKILEVRGNFQSIEYSVGGGNKKQGYILVDRSKMTLPLLNVNYTFSEAKLTPPYDLVNNIILPPNVTNPVMELKAKYEYIILDNIKEHTAGAISPVEPCLFYKDKYTKLIQEIELHNKENLNAPEMNGPNRCAWVVRLFGSTNTLVVSAKNLNDFIGEKTIGQPENLPHLDYKLKGNNKFSACTEDGIIALCQDSVSDGPAKYPPNSDGVKVDSSIVYPDITPNFWLTEIMGHQIVSNTPRP